MKKTLLLILSCLLFNSCSKNGEYFEKYENGNNKSISIYADDKLVSQTKFYENGNKMVEGNIKNGKWDGLVIEWNETGQKEKEFQWVNGVSDVGKEWQYYENGKLEWEKTYKDTTDNHSMVKWYDNGIKKFEGNYINQMLNGPSTIWFENGNKELEGTYKDAKKDGQFIEWHENGKKRFEGNFKDDKREGLLRGFNEEEQKVTEFQFVNDLKGAGKVWEYHDNGKPSKKWMYYDTTDTFVYEMWYETGNLGDFYLVKNEQIFRQWDTEKYPYEGEKYDYKQ